VNMSLKEKASSLLAAPKPINRLRFVLRKSKNNDLVIIIVRPSYAVGLISRNTGLARSYVYGLLTRKLKIVANV